MSFDPCPECGNTTGRNRVQVTEFFETEDHATEGGDWGQILRDQCAECDHVIFEHELYDDLH